MMAAKKEWSIAFQIGAKLQSSFPKAFKDAEKHVGALKKATKNAGAAWKDFGSKIRGSIKWFAGLAAAVGATPTAMLLLTNKTADYGKQLADTAEQLGMTTQGLQGYRYAAQKAGLTSEQFDQAVQKYRTNLAAWASDDKASKALAKFGLSAKKLYAMQPEKAFQRVADYMGKIKDPAKRAQLAVTMFGQQAGPKMAALLAKGSAGMKEAMAEAERLGLVWSKQQIEQAEAYKLAQDKMTGSLTEARNVIGTKIMPYFTQIFDQITQWVINNRPRIEEFADKVVAAFEAAIPKIKEAAKWLWDLGVSIWDTVQKVKDFVGGWGNLGKIVVGIWAVSLAWSALTAVMNTAQVAYRGVALAIKLVSMLKLKDKAETLYLHALYAKDAVVKGLVAAKTLAVAAAQKVATAAQWAFNAAMSANPIGLAVIALAALVAGFVLAYKKCEWFRDMVDGAVTAIVDFFKSATAKIPAFFTEAWEAVKASVGGFVQSIKDKFAPLLNFFDGIKSKISGIFGGKKTLDVGVNVSGAGEVPGHAAGGIFNKPHLSWFAEKAPRVPEAAIPIENTARSYDLWKRTGDMAGFGGEGVKPIVAPVLSGGETIKLSMPITIQGNATPETVQAFEQSRDKMVADMKRMIQQELSNRASRERRLSFAG